MRTFRYIFAILAIGTFICASPFHTKGQIVVRGYKCKFYEGQWPYTMSEMCSKNDTFRFTMFQRDIDVETANDEKWNRKKNLKIGLRMCFDEPYITTRDSLYISTFGDNSGYIYKVYDPDHAASISIRSRKNDSSFSAKSEWLLRQIRLHRKGDIFLINEKGQTCQNPDEPKQ